LNHPSINAYYWGDFKNGLRHGSGVQVFTNLEPDLELMRYEGDWEEDQRCGYGYLTLSNRSLFNGIWVGNLQIFGSF
jgi:MORN repeat